MKEGILNLRIYTDKQITQKHKKKYIPPENQFWKKGILNVTFSKKIKQNIDFRSNKKV